MIPREDTLFPAINILIIAVVSFPLFSPHAVSLGHPSAPAPSILYSASNLDWRFVSYMILYMFQCHYPKSSPSPSPTESKRLFYLSVSLLLSRIQGYRYHLSKFHICVSILYWCFYWSWLYRVFYSYGHNDKSSAFPKHHDIQPK